MSNRKKPKSSRKSQRSVASYVEVAKKLAKYAPSLKKYKRRKTLTRYEKSAITRKENALKYKHDLFIVSKKDAKKLKNKLIGPGINAIQLRNTSEKAKIKIRSDGVVVTSNGRTWEYHSVPSTDAPDMAELAEQLFEKGAIEIYLWTVHGRAGDGFRSVKQFMIWFQNNYYGYSADGKQPEEWINGIAARFE